MSDWGQGTVNNDISWGQGSVNNEIGWGSIYPASWSGETNIIGLIVTEIILSFKERVLADIGIFENEQVLIDVLTDINKIV